MASVPRLTRPETVLRPIPGQVAPAVDPFASASNPIAQGLANVAGVIQRERQYNDEIRVNDAELDYAQRLDKALVDPRDGLLNQQGTNAVTKLDGFRDRASMALSDVEASLATDEQKALFRRAAAGRQAAALSRADEHVGRELRRVDAASHEGLLARDMEAVGNMPTNDLGVQATVKGMRERILTYADRNGIPPEVAEQQVLDATSGARMMQVNALVKAGDYERAALTLYEFSDQFTTQDREKAQGIVTEATTRQTVVGAAEAILLAKDKDPKASTEALLRDVPLEHRADVRKYVNGELDAREKEQKQTHDTALLTATNAVERGNGRPARQVVDPGAWDSFSISERDALERMARPDGIKHNDAAWLNFYTLPVTDLRTMSQADFQTQYWSKFDTSHRDRALTMWKEAQQPQGSGGASGLLSPVRRVERTFQQMFQQPADKADWDDAQFGAFEQASDVAVMEASRAKGGKPLTDDELQAVLTRTATRMLTAPPDLASDDGWGEAMRSHARRGAWSLSDQYGVPREAEPAAPRPVVPYAAVPTPAADTISRQMREQGRSPTQDRVRRAFTALVLGDTVTYNAEVGTPPNPEAFAALRAGGFPSGMSPMTTVGKPWEKP